MLNKLKKWISMANSKDKNTEILKLSDLSQTIIQLSSFVYRNDENIESLKADSENLQQNIDVLLEKIHDLELKVQEMTIKSKATESIVERILDAAFKIAIVIASGYLLYLFKLPSP